MDNNQTREAKKARLVEQLTAFYGGPLPDDWREYLADTHSGIAGSRVCGDLRRTSDTANSEARRASEQRADVQAFAAQCQREQDAIKRKLGAGLDMSHTGETMGKLLMTKLGLERLLADAETTLAALDAQLTSAEARYRKLSALRSLAEARKDNQPISASLAAAVGCDLRDWLTDAQFAEWEEAQAAEAVRIEQQAALARQREAERIEREARAAEETARELVEIDTLSRYDLICRAFPGQFERATVSAHFQLRGGDQAGRAALAEFFRVQATYQPGPVELRIAERLREFDSTRGLEVK